jgi:hypothetical protein
MESGWNALIAFGPPIGAVMLATGIVSAVVFSKCGWRWWLVALLAIISVLCAGVLVGCWKVFGTMHRAKHARFVRLGTRVGALLLVSLLKGDI